MDATAGLIGGGSADGGGMARKCGLIVGGSPIPKQVPGSPLRGGLGAGREAARGGANSHRLTHNGRSKLDLDLRRRGDHNGAVELGGATATGAADLPRNGSFSL
ncbi:hypothetical protein U1Q18_006399 [Sarracenia purpurea var. burkii]